MAAEKMNGKRFVETLKEPNLLSLSNLRLTDGLKKPVEITYMDKGQPARESGQFFVSLPDRLANMLPDSYISPQMFVESFPKALTLDDRKNRLLSSHFSTGRELAFESSEDNFSLKVFHGSTNEHSLKLSKLAALGTTDVKNRHRYQSELAQIVRPVLETKSDAPIRIVEDCLASGDTVIGVVKAIGDKMKLNREMGKITLDVAVATAQGVMILKKFAQDNGINLDLNVGYMAFGLSKGGKGHEHANYIVYPEELVKELADLNPAINAAVKPEDQVVGDMGDFSKRIPKGEEDEAIDLPVWNRYRSDSYGGANEGDYPNPQFIEQANQHLVYLTNGGYLMRALYNYFNNPSGKERLSEVAFAAKRRWALEAEFGYGVILRDIDREILLEETI